MRSDVTWTTPPLSTTSQRAVARYRRGVLALVAGVHGARSRLAEAAALDPTFYLALVDLAITDALTGGPYAAPLATPEVLRGERQHAEIVESAFAGRHDRATHLRSEHLLEYPGDIVIVWLPVVWRPPG